MKSLIIFFTALMSGSLLFALYFGLAPVFNPLVFEEGPAPRTRGYNHASIILVVVFAVSAICLTWLSVAGARASQKN